MPLLMPEEQRRFAVEVVRRLRGAGFEAYWAGGCVRDQLLGRTPKDYDVATNAVPEQVRGLFGRRRTLAIGAAFGVIAVIGPKAAGTVEVTTFRRDAAYSDGRHPDSVAFSSAQEDASRRDFTINGLFYDPVEQRVIDFVGGQEDLAAKTSAPSATPATASPKTSCGCCGRCGSRPRSVLRWTPRPGGRLPKWPPKSTSSAPSGSPSRCGGCWPIPSRAAGVRLLVETGLAAEVLPEIVPRDDRLRCRTTKRWIRFRGWATSAAFRWLWPPLLSPCVDAAGAAAVCRRWRLSNKERERVCWLVEHRAALDDAPAMRWSVLQPLLVAEGIDDLLRLVEAASPAAAGGRGPLPALLGQPRQVLDPPPLLTGDDLLAQGIPSGPQYRSLLERLRAAQLDGEVRTKEEALAMVEKWRVESGG